MTRKLAEYGYQCLPGRSYNAPLAFWTSKTYLDWKANKNPEEKYILSQEEKERLDALIVN